MTRTTKREFMRFRAEFLRWRRKLGLQRWRVYFTHADKDQDAEASVTLEPEDSFARVNFQLLINEVHGPNRFDSPELIAKHEALELLFGRLNVLASSRYATEAEMDGARHEIIQILMELL